MATSETVKLISKTRYVGAGKAGAVLGTQTELMLLNFQPQGLGDSILGTGQIHYICAKSVADGFVVGSSYTLSIS